MEEEDKRPLRSLDADEDDLLTMLLLKWKGGKMRGRIERDWRSIESLLLPLLLVVVMMRDEEERTLQSPSPLPPLRRSQRRRREAE